MLLGEANRFGCFEGRVKERHAGEYSLGAGDAKLVLELGGVVGGAGAGDDAGKTVDGVGDGDVVDLNPTAASEYRFSTSVLPTGKATLHSPCLKRRCRRRGPIPSPSRLLGQRPVAC